MPTTKELTIRTEDRPGTLAKVCKALAERKVNILAFQSVPAEGNSVVRFVVDNPGTAKNVLDNEGLSYTETEVAQIDPSTNAPLIIFGVTDAGQAATILDRTAAAA